jgi:hypothetical protein
MRTTGSTFSASTGISSCSLRRSYHVNFKVMGVILTTANVNAA